MTAHPEAGSRSKVANRGETSATTFVGMPPRGRWSPKSASKPVQRQPGEFRLAGPALELAAHRCRVKGPAVDLGEHEVEITIG